MSPFLGAPPTCLILLEIAGRAYAGLNVPHMQQEAACGHPGVWGPEGVCEQIVAPGFQGVTGGYEGETQSLDIRGKMVHMREAQMQRPWWLLLSI